MVLRDILMTEANLCFCFLYADIIRQRFQPIFDMLIIYVASFSGWREWDVSLSKMFKSARCISRIL